MPEVTTGDDLRDLVASVVREMIGDLAQDAVREGGRAEAPGLTTTASAPETTTTASPGAQWVTPAPDRSQTQTVRISDDSDLDRFARHLLSLFENPKNRQDLRSGRLRFRLDNPALRSGTPVGPATRIESGAVTERAVKAAADAGHRIILGRRAVLTPLGREKARALDVHIEKERSC